MANAGYYLDTTSISPPELGMTVTETSRTTAVTGETTYTFEVVTMPEANLGFHVVLRKGYKATMVLQTLDDSNNVISANSYVDTMTDTAWQPEQSRVVLHSDGEQFQGRISSLPAKAAGMRTVWIANREETAITMETAAL